MSDAIRFEDQVVIVTGAGGGLGRAHALLFARHGAKVVVNDLGGSTHGEGANASAADKVVEEIRAFGGTAVANHDSVTDGDRIVQTALDHFGRIDVLVNNAGIVRDNLLAAMDDEEITSVIQTNLLSVFHVTRAVIPFMMSRRSGQIVNLSSVAATKGGRGQANYAASKGAVEAMTRALAVELSPRKIRVNAVAPGVIETSMSQQVRDLAGDEVKARILLKRYGQPEEIAKAVTFLASDLSSYVTGQILYVDGGFKMA